jgi:hypothetical protein
MPRYYFHLRDDLNVDDDEGTNLPSLEAARRRAVNYALNMAAAAVLEQHKLTLSHRIEVADDTGGIAMTVTFGDVVAIKA